MTKIYEVVIDKPKITSKFGKRKDPITGKIKMHNGLDLISKVKNRNLYAIDDGYVQIVHKGNTGYGNYIWVRYPRYDLSLLYAHCSSLKLKKGDSVKRGTIVAIEGSSGRATGVHLHLGMTHIGSNTYLNPENYNILPDKYNLTRLLKKGCKGEDVKKAQEELTNRGFKCKVNGIYDENMIKEVKKYQKIKGFSQDGKIGKPSAHSFGWLYKGK